VKETFIQLAGNTKNNNSMYWQRIYSYRIHAECMSFILIHFNFTIFLSNISFLMSATRNNRYRLFFKTGYYRFFRLCRFIMPYSGIIFPAA